MSSKFRPGMSFVIEKAPEPGVEQQVPQVVPLVAHQSVVSVQSRTQVVPYDTAMQLMAKETTSVLSNQSTRHLLGNPETWGWEEIRDYVVGRIEAINGPSPRDLFKEAGIFKGFLKRYGAKASKIAQVAFEIHGGMWRSAPIRVERFCAGSDPFFGDVISKNL